MPYLSPGNRIPLAEELSATVLIMHPFPLGLLLSLTPRPCSVGTASIDTSICFRVLPNKEKRL